MKVIEYFFKKITHFKYLGMTLLITMTGVSKKVIIQKAARSWFAILKYFKSKLYSKETKVMLYMAIETPTVTYGCKIWPTTQRLDKKLLYFINKVPRKMCGPMFNN